MNRLLICSISVLLFVNIFDLTAAADKESEAGNVKVKVLGHSGKIELSMKDKGDNDTIKISMEGMQERDSNNNTVGSTGNKKHSFNTFANQDFTFSSVVNTQLQGLKAKSFNFSAFIATTGATLTCDIYIFEEEGEIVFGEEVSPVKNGTVKFNIRVQNWEFCNGNATGCKQGQNYEFGSFLDFTIAVQSKKKPEEKSPRKQSTSNPGKKSMQLIDLGGAYMELASWLKIDDKNMTAMPRGYPKYEQRGSKHSYTFRFPKFTSSVLFDPTLGFGESDVNGTGTTAPERTTTATTTTGDSGTAVKFSGILMSFLMFLVGYFAY